MLQKHGQFNDLSPEFRQEMEEKVKALGKKVKFKFNISKENPDPEKIDGAKIYPNKYTLDPVTFRVLDNKETRVGASKSKEIGLVNMTNEDGKPTSFFRIRVEYREQGEKVFSPEESYDDFEYVMYLLMHPKLKDGMFQDKDRVSIIELVDEQKEARERKEKREQRSKATAIAREMDDAKIQEFADAMQWENGDIDFLRDQVEDLAETDPKFFNDLIAGKNIEYQSVVKRALDKKVIEFDPADYKFFWSSNKQIITVLSPHGDKSQVEKLSDWFQTGGQKADEAFKRVKGLVKEK